MDDFRIPHWYLNTLRGFLTDVLSWTNEATEEFISFRFRGVTDAILHDTPGSFVAEFAVPISFRDSLLEGEDQLITEFFIVPFFGACLHLPPPPPNQIIHVNFESGVELPNLQAAFWFEGELKLKNVSNDMGASAYAMQINQIIPYEDWLYEIV